MFIKKQTSLPGWMNNIPMYSLWCIILHDYYIKTLNAGETEILIKPYLGNLNYVKCVYPTINGNIIVEHNKTKNGEILTKVSNPQNIKIILENCKKVST